MKKNSVFVALLGFVLTTLCGCGPKSVKGADGKEYDSYQSACRNQDFVAAYDWIEKNNGSEEDKDYVFNVEMLYLTSLGTEEASNRIVYLLAEYQIPGTPIPKEFTDDDYYVSDDLWDGANQYYEGIVRFNKRCDNVLDMAIAQGNMDLAKKILYLYKDDININWNRSEKKNMSVRRPAYLPTSKNAAKTRYISILLKDAEKSDNFSELDIIISQMDFTLEDDIILSYLASKQDRECSESIIKLLNPYKKMIPAKPMMGKIAIADYKYKDEVCNPYTEAVKKYNDQCTLILNLAIKARNQYLAKRALEKIKPNINRVKLPETKRHIYEYDIKIDNTAMNSAKAEYQEAIRNGAFK